jgi:chromosome partitioning protein
MTATAGRSTRLSGKKKRASPEDYGFNNKSNMTNKVIAVSNHKGGVGKTTSVVNIGAGLSRSGKRVLLIDLDPQANLTQSLRINAERNIYGSLRGLYPLSPVEVSPKLFAIPSTLDLSGAEIEIAGEIGRERILRKLIEPIRGDFDYILIDSPPSLGLLTINALTAADEVYIPLQAQYLSLQGLSKLREVIDRIGEDINPGLRISGIVVTQYDSRKVLNRDVASTIREHYPEETFKTEIRDNISLAEAPTQGADIFSYSPSSSGAQDYGALCREIIKRQGGKKAAKN